MSAVEYPASHGLAGQAEVLNETAAGFDPRRVWAAVYRSRLVIVAIIFICLAIGLVVNLLTTPVYEASASVQIEQQTQKVLGTEDMESAASGQDAERFLQTQVDILRSRTLATTVAQELRLFDNKNFLTTMGAEDEFKAVGRISARDMQRKEVIDVLLDNLDIYLPPISRIATITFSSPDPELAARVANSFAQNFIAGNLQRKFDNSAYAREFLSGQLNEARQRLEESERASIAYARRSQLIDASNSTDKDEVKGPRSLTVSTLVQLNAAYSEALSRRIAAQQKWEQANGADILSLPEVLSNQAVQELLQERAKLQAAYEEERQRRKADYPTVRQAAAQLAEINNQINKIATSIRQSLRQDYEVARRQEQGLEQQLGGLKRATLDEQTRGVQLSILTRAADTNRGLYDALLQRYRELSAEAGVQANNISLIDRANVPVKPKYPKILLNLAVALFAGIALSAAYVFANEQLDDTIRSGQDVQDKLNLPMLGAVPMLPANSDVDEVLDDPKSMVSEAYHSIRTALLLSSTHGLPRTILFTSAQPSEGKSTTSYAMARDLGRIGKRVVVVDVDLRRPSLAKRFGSTNKLGVSSVLTGQSSLGEIISSTPYENVSFVASGPMPPDPTELLSSENLDRMLADLSDQFDVVLLDSAPVMGLADTVWLATKVEATVVVIESGRNHHGGSKLTLNRLRKSGARIIGVILSKHDARESGYGYEYAYSYRYGD